MNWLYLVSALGWFVAGYCVWELRLCRRVLHQAVGHANDLLRLTQPKREVRKEMN